jgi:hypothetical protein
MAEGHKVYLAQVLVRQYDEDKLDLERDAN